MTDCHRYLPGENPAEETVRRWGDRTSWTPMFYPQANAVADAHPFVLHPGERIKNIDFHLRAITEYAVQGSILLSDGSKAKSLPFPPSMYSHGLVAVPLDPAIASVDVSIPCDWSTPNRDFHCQFLSPGDYELRFDLAGIFHEVILVPWQRADVHIHISAGKRIPPLRVKLVNGPAKARSHEPPPRHPGQATISIQHACPAQLREQSFVYVAAMTDYGPGASQTAKYDMEPCYRPIIWKLAPGQYSLLAAVAMGTVGPKIIDLLRSHAQPLTVSDGMRANIELKVWTTEDTMRLALESLGINVRSGSR